MTTTPVDDGFVDTLHTSPPRPAGFDSTLVRERLALSLGLTAQSRRPTGNLVIAQRHYREWRGGPLRNWQAFLPTIYPEHTWGRYTFDTVPTRALQAIQAAKDSGAFEGLQIWTAERPRHERTFRSVLGGIKRTVSDVVDPVAVGIVEGRVFPVVRWGQEELISERAVRWRGRGYRLRAALLG